MKKIVMLVSLVLVIGFSGCASKEKATPKEVPYHTHKAIEYYIHIDTTHNMNSLIPLRYLLDTMGEKIYISENRHEFNVYTGIYHSKYEARKVLHTLRREGYQYASIVER